MKEYFECACFSPEHVLKFSLEEDEPEIYVFTFLAHRSFYKRVWTGIKYIFGYKCKYGHFDEFILQSRDVEKLINLLKEYKERGLVG